MRRAGMDRGVQNTRSTYFPAITPHDTPLSALRKLSRVYPEPQPGTWVASNGGARSAQTEDEGSGTTPGDPATNDPVELTIANGGSEDYDFGAMASYGRVSGEYYLVRGTLGAADVIVQCGRLEIVHDGDSTAACLPSPGPTLPDGANPGITFSASIVAGALRLTVDSESFSAPYNVDTALRFTYDNEAQF